MATIYQNALTQMDSELRKKKAQAQAGTAAQAGIKGSSGAAAGDDRQKYAQAWQAWQNLGRNMSTENSWGGTAAQAGIKGSSGAAADGDWQKYAQAQQNLGNMRTENSWGNSTAAQAGIKGAVGVGATVAGAMPMGGNAFQNAIAQAESAKPKTGAAAQAQISTLPWTGGQAQITNPVGTPGQAQIQKLPNIIGSQSASKGGSQAGQQAQGGDYLLTGSPAAGFQAGMNGEDQASWEAIGNKYAAGDSSWNKDTNQFREDGNWGSYYDADGNINGWLYAVNGTGGYAPVFGGKVGETGYDPGTVFVSPDGKAYTMGADGTLALSGNAEWAKYGSYVGPKAGYQDSSFWVLENGKYKKYTNQTAPQEVLNSQGYYRDSNGLVRPIDSQYYIQQALKEGAITPEQAALAQEAAKGAKGSGIDPTKMFPDGIPGTGTGGGGGGGGQYPTGQTGGGGGYVPQGTPGGTGGGTGYVPTDSTPPQGTTGGTQPNPTAWQDYLSQWEYPDAPEWEGTPYEEMRDELLQNAMNPYEGSPYDQQRDDALAAYGEEWQGSPYQEERDAALKRAQDMRWDYDPNTDPVWQALQKQYRREGDRATQQALGQAAARTGGVPSSYAVTAASQAGDYYASQLSDRLPQVYQDAYNRYLQEFQRQMGISDQYQGFDDREYARWADQQGRNLDLADRYNQYGQQDYNRYMDRVSQQLQGADRYNQYGGTEYQRYLDQLGQYNTDRNFDYGRYRDAIGDARYDDETRWNREQYVDNKNYERWMDQQDLNYRERQFAQELLEYADSQRWKAAEWEQYLREYGDQLSEKERQWAYQIMQDQVEQDRWNAEFGLKQNQTAFQQRMAEEEFNYGKEQDALSQENWEKQFGYNAEQDALGWGYKNDQFQDSGSSGSGAYSGGDGSGQYDDTGMHAGKWEDSDGYTYVGYHPDGQPMSKGYNSTRSRMMSRASAGASKTAITKELIRLVENRSITEYEANMILQELGWKTSSAGTGRNTIGPNSVNMVQ